LNDAILDRHTQCGGAEILQAAPGDHRYHFIQKG
jgi:hypothetical protein